MTNRLSSGCLLLAACLGLSACSTPSLDRGFAVRADLATTDCNGRLPDDQSDGGPFNFLTQKTPGEPIEVRDCVTEGKVQRAAGLAVKPGDVIFVGTGAVAPLLGLDKKPFNVMFPAVVAAPVGLVMRKVDPVRGRLYQQEDQFLAGAFSMAARTQNQVLQDSTALAQALDRQQLVLWNALIDSLRIWRPRDTWEGASSRQGLGLLVDYGRWCDGIRQQLGGAADNDKDRRAITEYFSGVGGRCPGDDPGDDLNQKTREYSLISNVARSALHAVAHGPKAQGGFPSQHTDVALHTNLTVQIKGARLASTQTYGSSAHWTLADWEGAGICQDERGKPLQINALQMRDGKRVYVQSQADPSTTLAIQLVFTQSLQARRFEDTVPWFMRWKRVVGRQDLDKLYPADIQSVTWSAPPADPAMCLL